MNVGPRGATCHSACPVLRHSESDPLGLSVHNCRAWGLLVVRLPAPFVPHSASLRPATASHGSPLLPGCLSPPLLPVWMNVSFLCPWCRTSLPFDFLSVLVVRGGAVCLPMPPSWFPQNDSLKNYKSDFVFMFLVHFCKIRILECLKHILPSNFQKDILLKSNMKPSYVI